MNKSELSLSLAEELDLPEKEAQRILSTILGAMSEALARGEHIELRDFGSFSIRQYGSYSGRNPKTGEAIPVKPKKLPFFKPGKYLRETVDENK
ncbi:MAG: HU family DNA-binding protein [Desulfobulbia bacterium]